MCGINGWLIKEGTISTDTFLHMRDTLAHRGPDDAGANFFQHHKVALGHRRLSFLELGAKGHQPMQLSDSGIWIVYNGEIYNYLELKSSLEQSGAIFTTNSDTEVLLHAYQQWGTDMFEKLNGMFSIAIWNDNTQQLLLARDRYGIKPLYYHYSETQFLFASEIKAISACPTLTLTLNKAAVADFLNYRFIPSPKSIWNEVNKLAPAHYLVYDYSSPNTSPLVCCYWSHSIVKTNTTRADAMKQVEALLSQSLDIHLRSEVPIGSFLSAGIDSTTLTALRASKDEIFDTFSIGFEGWENSEHLLAGANAKRFNLPFHQLILDGNEVEQLDELMYYYDEPIADISIIPTFYLCKLAASKVKAAISGEGADELFAGYQWQKDFLQKKNFMQRIKQLFGLYTDTRKNITEYYAQAMSMGRFNMEAAHRYLHQDMHSHLPADTDYFYREKKNNGGEAIDQIRLLDLKSFMGELVLTKIDRASMAHGLEVRVPFLDNRLVAYMLSLESSIYFDEHQPKILLSSLLKKWLPESFTKRKKQGFVGPDKYYMNIDWYAKQLQNGNLVNQNILSEEGLKQLIIEKDHWRLWKLTVLEIWMRKWL